MVEFLKSKKATGFIIGVVVVVGVQYAGLSEETATKIGEGIVKMVLMYLGLQGGTDMVKASKEKPAPKRKK